MICNKCGKEILLNARFCVFCGAPVEIKEEQDKDLVRICPKCGTEIETAFCVKCGSKAKLVKRRKCSRCGAVVSEGDMFCTMCGTKISDSDSDSKVVELINPISVMDTSSTQEMPAKSEKKVTTNEKIVLEDKKAESDETICDEIEGKLVAVYVPAPKQISVNKKVTVPAPRRICPICKAENDEDALFCTNCGKSIGNKQNKRCPKCGADVEEDAIFCIACGARV